MYRICKSNESTIPIQLNLINDTITEHIDVSNYLKHIGRRVALTGSSLESDEGDREYLETIIANNRINTTTYVHCVYNHKAKQSNTTL